jgi:nucleoside-diphosphate-sugar epimerase
LLTSVGPFLKVFREAYPQIPVTVLLRTTVLDGAVAALGNVTIVHADLSKDIETVQRLAGQHDLVINMANSRDPEINGAIVDGINNCEDKTKKGIILHLSGAGNFSDERRDGVRDLSSGYFVDTNREQVRKVNKTMEPNGASDEIVIKSALDGEIIAYIVCPAGIYGASQNHVARAAGEAGTKYANTPGIWAGWMIENIETLGFSPYVGDGDNIFCLVHVDDIVSLMMLVIKKIFETDQDYKPDDVLDNFYLGVTEEYAPKSIAQAFGKMLAKKGKISNGEARKVPYEEAGLAAR